MKTIKQLLKLVLKEFNTNYHLGLCSANDRLRYNKVTSEEYRLFKTYLIDNKPKNHKHYDTDGDITRSSNHFYWKPKVKYYRIAWLKKHIKLNT